MLAGAIGARCRLFQASVFRDYSAFSLKTLFHLVRSLNYFFATRTALLQISFAEAFDFRCASAWVYFNLITEPLELLCKVHPVNGRGIALASIQFQWLD